MMNPSLSTATAVPPPPATARPREIVAIFTGIEALEQAIGELEQSGFARCTLSVSGQQSGPCEGKPAVLLADDPQANKVEHVSTEERGDAEGALVGAFAYVPAVGTAWAASAAGASVLSTMGLMIATGGTGGTGALVGVALAAMLSRRWHEAHRRQMEKGGLLLWITLRSIDQEAKAVAILERRAALHVHSHDLP